jgi:hypothetical protein
LRFRAHRKSIWRQGHFLALIPINRQSQKVQAALISLPLRISATNPSNFAGGTAGLK